jgi:hypothetical protein
MSASRRELLKKLEDADGREAEALKGSEREQYEAEFLEGFEDGNDYDRRLKESLAEAFRNRRDRSSSDVIAFTASPTAKRRDRAASDVTVSTAASTPESTPASAAKAVSETLPKALLPQLDVQRQRSVSFSDQDPDKLKKEIMTTMDTIRDIFEEEEISKKCGRTMIEAVTDIELDEIMYGIEVTFRSLGENELQKQEVRGHFLSIKAYFPDCVTEEILGIIGGPLQVRPDSPTRSASPRA